MQKTSKQDKFQRCHDNALCKIAVEHFSNGILATFSPKVV